MRAALVRATIPLLVELAIWEAERDPTAREVQALANGSPLSSIPLFTVKGIILSLNLYIQTAFTLGNNKGSFYSTSRFLHIGLCEGSTEANVQ